MSKYIDAEKLLLELNKRMGEYDVQQITSEHPEYEQGAQDALYNLKLQLASFQQEQPEVDLEKEIQDWCKENVTGVKPIYTADSLIYDLLPKAARYFYKLRLNARKEE